MPLGAWTAAAALDALEVVTGEEPLGAGADAAVTVGLAGSSIASSTGLTDWQHLQGHTRRIGVGHALMNMTAVGSSVSRSTTCQSCWCGVVTRLKRCWKPVLT
jgi:hypothetical protein